MSSENRKPFLIAAACAVVAVVVFALASGFGGRDATGAAGWKDRLGGLGLGSELSIAELRPAGGNCKVEAARITIVGSCALAVDAFGGAFSLQAVKSAELVPSSAVKLTLTLEGTSTTEAVKSGCRISAVFGRSGGALTVSCSVPTSPCAIELGPGKDCSKD